MSKSKKPASKKPKGLGRGLSALMGDDMPVVEGREIGAAPPERAERAVPVAQLVRNKNQPRSIFDKEALVELSQSIREKGILQPLLVREIGKDKYEIVAGERRWRAAQLASLHEIPVVVRDLSDVETLELGIIENIQREDLTAIEEAVSYQRLMDECGHTQNAVSKIVGKSRSHIANLLRLLTLPKPVQKMVNDGKLTMGHARALVGADDPKALAQRILSAGLSVRQAEALVSGGSAGATPKGNAKSSKKDADTVALEKDLKAALGGMKVVISHKGESGEVVIKYRDLEELDTLCSKLGVCGF